MHSAFGDILRRQTAGLKVYACAERGRKRLKIIPQILDRRKEQTFKRLLGQEQSGENVEKTSRY